MNLLNASQPLEASSLPLTDVTVLDLTDEPVALASRLLADLGADVIRVEDPAGDWLRRRGPFVGDQPGLERSLAHILYNAGKQSIALDLSRAEGWDIVARLAGRCDVLIAPLEKSPAARRWFESIASTAAPVAVRVVDPVFRRGNDDIATDLIGMAAGGHLYLDGYAEDPPNHPAGNLAYKQLALAAAFAAMSLILDRTSPPSGHITVSMQEAVMWTTIQSANENYWHWHEARPTRHGIGSLGGQTVFECRDGLWVSLYHHPPSFPAAAKWFAEVLGDGHFLEPEWADGLYRYHHNAEITAATTSLCAAIDRAELVAEAQRRAILAVPVQSVADIAADPHLRERGFFQRAWFEHLGAELEVLRAPFISSAYEVTPKAPPALGEHTRDVLRDLGGMDDSAIDAVFASGIATAREAATV
jgi:crotonobetainyl-CoA:carnitine CoA-transferase CaiB-like acyl-CoA transferase